MIGPYSEPASLRFASCCRIGFDAAGPVYIVGGGVVGEQESQVVVDLGKARVHDLRGHEVGHHLLHPDIIKPAHGHQVAEPHVRGLVGDHAGAPEQLVLRRRVVEHQAGGVVEDGARVLHAAELEGGDQHEIEFAPGIRDRRCNPPARRGRARGGRRSHRGCAPPSRRRSPGETCGTCGRCARRSRPGTCPPRRRTDRSAAAASRRNGPPIARWRVSRPVSAPLAVACHAAGMSRESE